MFIYFWLRWVFVAAQGVAASGGCSLAAVRGLLVLEASLAAELGLQAERAAVVAACGLCGAGSVLVVHGLSCASVCILCGMSVCSEEGA